MDNLAVIIPVYNEQEIIETVINQWILKFNELKIDYKIFAYNDGSTDNTEIILEKIAKNNLCFIPVSQQNCWHGPTVLKGYKNNASDFTWIFQIDSDNEMGPEDFHLLWEKRFDYDFLTVKRAGRKQSLTRKLVSLASRVCIRIFYGNNGPWDVNSPYRLMRTEKFIDLFNKLSDDTLSPNIIISGFVSRKKLRFYEQSVKCLERQTGEVSLKKMKLLKTALKSFWQAMVFSFIIK